MQVGETKGCRRFWKPAQNLLENVKVVSQSLDENITEASKQQRMLGHRHGRVKIVGEVGCYVLPAIFKGTKSDMDPLHLLCHSWRAEYSKQ